MIISGKSKQLTSKRRSQSGNKNASPFSTRHLRLVGGDTSEWSALKYTQFFFRLLQHQSRKRDFLSAKYLPERWPTNWNLLATLGDPSTPTLPPHLQIHTESSNHLVRLGLLRPCNVRFAALDCLRRGRRGVAWTRFLRESPAYLRC